MTRAHTPPANTPPPEPEGGTPITDLVPGDPPVPITVWRTPIAAGESATIPARLAQRLVAAYSTRRGVVVDLTDDQALTGAALAGGCRHHAGVFNDTAVAIRATPTVAANPPGPRPRLSPGTVAGGHPHDDQADPVVRFGDGPQARMTMSAASTAIDRLRQATGLVAACWPLHPGDPAANQRRLTRLLHAASWLLGRGGCLVLVVRGPAGHAAAVEDFGPLIAAARTAGLGYLQHIVAVHADADGDQLTYQATTAQAAVLTDDRHVATADVAPAHLRVHADLLVFAPAGGAHG